MLSIQKKNILSFCTLLLLSLMMVFIAQFYAIKILCMAVIVVLGFKNVRISKFVLLNFILLLTYGVYGTVIGLFYHNPNPFQFLGVFFFWPIFWLFFISYFSASPGLFEKYLKILFISHVAIVLFDFLFVVAAFNGINLPNPFYGAEVGFSIYDSSTRMTFINLNTLTFTTPILFILFFTQYKFGIRRIYQILNIILTIILLIISGRRSVMLMCVSLFFLPIIFSGYFSKEIRKTLAKIILILLIAVLIGAYYIEHLYPGFWEGYYQIVLNAFDASEEPVKFAQAEMFYKAILEKPFFGHGFGAIFFEAEPGRMIYSSYFELSYHQKLATTGIVGFSMIMFVFISTLGCSVYLSKKNKDSAFLAIAIGLFFMLVADATNPVLCSFDLMWPLYLCLAKINSYQINNTL